MLDVKELQDAIEVGNAEKVAAIIKEFNLKIVDGKITANDEDIKEFSGYWDRRQHSKKILLNSAYGAINVNSSKWNDTRIGQSTTLTGRCITRHMGSKINEIITGEYNLKGKAIIYGDTDSIFFSAYPVMKDDPEFKDFSWAKEDIIALYDQIADITNASFPEFMHKTFNVPLKRGEVIKAGREICGSRGLFITKKRYAIMVFDKEGKRKDVNGKAGDIKVMGLEIKRSDSQLIVQQFLYKILESVLLDKPQGEIFAMIREFKEEFRKMPPWTVGTPKKCNNMTKFYNIKKNSKKVDVFGGKSESSKPPNIPWHVLGALNFNELKNIMGTTDIPDIIDGDKVLIVRLKNNIYGYNTIAIPDVTIMPEWLKALPYDMDVMEDIIVNKKVENLLSVLGWDLTKINDGDSTFGDMFSF